MLLKQVLVQAVEMTQNQKDILDIYINQGYSLLEILLDADPFTGKHDFDDFWAPLTQEQVAVAYMYPKLVKVREN